MIIVVDFVHVDVFGQVVQTANKVIDRIDPEGRRSRAILHESLKCLLSLMVLVDFCFVSHDQNPLLNPGRAITDRVRPGKVFVGNC